MAATRLGRLRAGWAENPYPRMLFTWGILGGSVQVSNSKASVSANTIGGSLQCHGGATLAHWDADDTNSNDVHGSDSCSGSTKMAHKPGADTNIGPAGGQPNGDKGTATTTAGVATHKNTAPGQTNKAKGKNK